MTNDFDVAAALATLSQKQFSALFFEAIIENNASAVSRLIDSGAKLDVPNQYDNTPLHLAASNGLTDIVRLLVENGATLDVPNEDGDTALHLAALNGHTDIKNFLGKFSLRPVNAERPAEPNQIAAIRNALGLN